MRTTTIAPDLPSTEIAQVKNERVRGTVEHRSKKVIVPGIFTINVNVNQYKYGDEMSFVVWNETQEITTAIRQPDKQKYTRAGCHVPLCLGELAMVHALRCRGWKVERG